MQPLVSCIMPTANRRRFVERAIPLFLRQDYPARELVILDDGSDSVEDLASGVEGVRYFRCSGGLTLGAKRNECVRLSRGELILHWDDDDWMAPRRISRQVRELLSAGAGVCGLDRMLFHDPSTGKTWLYSYSGDGRWWLAGGPSSIRASFGSDRRFPTSRSARTPCSSGVTRWIGR